MSLIQFFFQWKRYITKYTTLKLYCVRTKKDCNDDPEFYGQFDLILVTPSKHLYIQSLFYSYIISRVVYDEVDTLKIKNCAKINATFHWYVSSSTENLIHPQGIWRVLNKDYNKDYNKDDFFTNGYFDGHFDRYRYTKTDGITSSKYIKDLFIELQSFPYKFKNQLFLSNSDIYIDQSLKLPDYLIETIICDNPYEISILGGFLNNKTMALINAGDIKSVINNFECKYGKEENLINIICDKYFKKLNNLKIELEGALKMEYDSEVKKVEKISEIEHDIKETETKINLIHSRIQEGNLCPICYSDPVNKTIVNCCNNVFCLECISVYLETIGHLKCPLCRSTEIKLSNFVIQCDEVVDKEEEIDKKTKLSVIEDLLIKYKDCEEKKKILIFSEFTASFEAVISY